MFLREADRSGRAWLPAPSTFTKWLPAVQDALKRGAWAEIPPLFDAVLTEAFSSPPPRSAMAAARAFSEKPEDPSPGIGAIAERLKYSRRQVERQVQSVTGISPKRLSSLARFHFMRDALWAEPNSQLALLALNAGYADQAHMTREFKKYSGQTPSDFRRNCTRLKRLADKADVAFIQDRRR